MGQQRSDPAFNVTTKITPRNTGNNQWDNIQFVYPFYLYRSAGFSGDSFTLAFGWNNQTWYSDRQYMIHYGVENIVFNPAADETYNNTPLNCYDCDPFFMYKTVDQQTLLLDLENVNVANFYWDGHGNIGSIGSTESQKDADNGLSSLDITTVSENLHNRKGSRGWQQRHHPYRLVILDCCLAGQNAGWAKAFGIEPNVTSKQMFERQGEQPQALVAWTTEIDGPSGRSPSGYGLNDVPPSTFYAYGDALARLFSDWMTEVPLMQCLADASTPDGSGYDFPMNPNWRIFGDPNLTRDPAFEP